MLALTGAIALCAGSATTYAGGAGGAPPGGVAYVTGPVAQKAIDLVSGSGGTPRRLVLGTDYVSTFAWSPDGRRLAFGRRGLDGDTDLWIRDMVGRERRLVRNGRDPSWSPDGKRIAFTRDPKAFAFAGKIFTIGANGRGLHKASALLSNEEEPQWSPDGKHLAFLTKGEVWTMTPAGARPTRIAVCAFVAPSWSPNGKRLAFTSCGPNGRNPATAGVYVADLKGRLRRVAGATSVVSWSPNGSWLALCCVDGVAVVHPDGTGYRRLADTDFWSIGGRGVSWAPDSRRLAFVKGDPDHPRTADIWVVALDGSGARRITDAWTRGDLNTEPRWRPRARG